MEKSNENTFLIENVGIVEDHSTVVETLASPVLDYKENLTVRGLDVPTVRGSEAQQRASNKAQKLQTELVHFRQKMKLYTGTIIAVDVVFAILLLVGAISNPVFLTLGIISIGVYGYKLFALFKESK